MKTVDNTSNMMYLIIVTQKWKIIYYEDIDGYSKVYDFIEKQNMRNQAKIFSWISLLEQKGPNLPRPYADLLKDEIHELRIKLSGTQIRILYFFCHKEFIVLSNSFIKKTKKIPEKEINIAKKNKTNFIRRYSEIELREEYDENI